MRHVDPQRWSAALGAYAAAGALIGLAASPMQAWAQNHLGRGGLGVFFAINILLPLASALISVWHPRVWTAIVGGFLVAGCFTFVRVAAFDWRVWEWKPAFVANRTSPIELFAGVGCAIVGSFAAMVVVPWRRVGLADAAQRCDKCGYLLNGAEGTVCPECGHASAS